jgi:hypothetical protein
MRGMDPANSGPRLERLLRSIEPKTAGIAVAIPLALVGTLGAIQAAQGPVEAEGAPAPHGFLAVFYLDGEYNLHALLSAAIWVLAAASLYAAGRARERGRRRYVWFGLAIGLVYFALDEALKLHERLEGKTGVDWQVLYLPLFVTIALGGLYVLLQSHGTTRILLFFAGAAAFAAQVLEAVQWNGDEPIAAYRALMVPEEILEPTAATLILVAALTLLRQAQPLL